jgi:hypothetical protein
MADDELRTCFQNKSTEELLDIWRENDQAIYREDVFVVIRQILSDRKCNLPRQKQFADENTPQNVLPEERRLPVSQYPKAWKEYSRRWYALLLGILASFIYFFVVINYLSLARKGVFVPIISELMQNTSPAISKPICNLIAIVPVLAIIMILYIRFDSWPCPRCGISFNGLGDKMPIRADVCSFCGLRRNAISDEPNASAL